ncbi:unnamed protein product [Miscanthus lutarioriparius]|uniref:Uncharacterized protein n=1 Tax=Miscanthus lutarioriparius TaxID=422564 RepID=A0A811QJI5_9POAL|nr:unnamed protein product [Miscanthus lutarioriparius]
MTGGFGLPPIGAAMDQSRWTMESFSSSRMVDGVTANYNKVLRFLLYLPRAGADGVAVFSGGGMEDHLLQFDLEKVLRMSSAASNPFVSTSKPMNLKRNSSDIRCKYGVIHNYMLGC